jgi:N-acetylmuramoyl-L-alanine amidase
VKQSRGRRRRLAVLVVVVVAVVALGAWGLGSYARHAAANDARSTPSGGTPLDQAAFAAGACQAFAPTSGNRGLTVFLDGGHGGIDPGGVGTTEDGGSIDEADATLPIELDAMALLRAQGFRVVVSRTTSSTVVRLGDGDTADGALTLQGSHDDVAARDVCANLAKADVLVGIYLDAGASQDNAGSVTAYDADRPFSTENLRFATLLQSDVLSAMNAQGWGIPDDGTLPDTGFGSSVGDPSAGGLAADADAYDHLLLIGPAMSGYFTTPSDMPGAVVEPLYITDPFEGSIADSAQGQSVIAQGIATAVEQYLAPGAK